jgi:ornithine cyclodeaminase
MAERGNAPVWLTEADVTASIDLRRAIRALETALAAEAARQAASMTKTHLMVGKNNALQAIGGAIHPEGLCGTKTWVNIDGKSQTILVVYSLVDGSLKAVIEATALGQLRTAAISGLGTDWLAPARASELAMIGTGKQALPQIAAVLAVRPITRVRVFSRKEENRAALVAAAKAKFPGLNLVASPSLAAALDGAPIVTLCTNATQPFVDASMFPRGVHINAIGAIVLARAEFAADIFARATVIAVDSVEAVKEVSREFIDYFGAGSASWDLVKPISALIKSGARRPANADLTLFKAMGMGISDLALAVEVLRRCAETGRGHILPPRVRSDLPLETVTASD